MTEQKTLTYYARKGQPIDVATFVSVSEQRDGNVHFHNAWGGRGYFASEEDFAADFELVPAEELERIFRTYRTVRVTWNDGDGFMTGFTTGQLWNGFECPSFTKDEILAQTRPGGHLSGEDMRSNRFIWSDLADTFIRIEGVDGTNLPDEIDLSAIEPLLAEGKEDEAEEVAEEMGMLVSLAPKFTAVPMGEPAPVVLFVIDDGWCWANMDDYEMDVGNDDQDDAAPAASI